MRRDNAVFRAEQRVIGGWRFLIENVRSVSRKFSTFKCFGNIVRIGEFAAATINQCRAVFHVFNRCLTNHVASLFGQVRVERDNVAFFQQLRDAVDALDILLFGKLLRPVKIIADAFHAEGIGPDGDFASNSAESNNANRFPHDFVARHSVPTARGSCVRLLHQILVQRKE